jgi:hypothetical protein
MALDNEDIKQLIAILQKGLTPDTDSLEDSETMSVKKTRRSTPKAKTETKPKSKNKFDSMPEFNMCKEDIEFDRKVRKPIPSARLRDFEPIKVRCRVCGKNEKVAPDLVESIERYKCNKCSTGAG